jgi:hypothetical protein
MSRLACPNCGGTTFEEWVVGDYLVAECALFDDDGAVEVQLTSESRDEDYESEPEYRCLGCRSWFVGLEADDFVVV